MMCLATQNTVNMRVCSYNCRGFNDSKSQYIRKLLSNCDFLLLQEHWLAESQLICLSTISDDYLAAGVCGFDSSEVLPGRPFGGCAILWRKNIDANVTFVDTGNRRLCALKISSHTAKFLLVSVYMPYEDGNVNSDRTEEFISVLSSIEYLNSLHADCTMVIGGDFNVDLDRCRNHTTIFNKFCDLNDLFPAVHHCVSNVDYTYQFCMTRFNILDHFILPNTLYSAVSSLSVLHDVDNISDHDPLFITLNIPLHLITCTERVYKGKTAWHKASSAQLDDYGITLQNCLHSIILPVDVLACKDVSCCDPLHREKLDKFACDVSRACLTAAGMCIPRTSGRKASGVIPGWNAEVEPVRQTSIFWHNMWIQCGRPRTGLVADIMRRTRAKYHYTIRSVKKREQDIINERFAQTILNRTDRDFWYEVKRIRSNKTLPCNIVDNVSNAPGIADFFADKYEDLYSCVGFCATEMDNIRKDIDSLSVSAGYDSNCVFTSTDVKSVINRLHPGKSDGSTGLTTEHIKYACNDFFVYVAMLFTGMTVHGFVPDDMRLSTIVPIPKGKNINLTDSNNYRGIALGSLLGKVFDLILLECYSDFLATSELQFGFKARRSTNMCSMILKETMSYYVNHHSPVFCTMLDATKAFDRVRYTKLFRLLLARRLPPVVLRVLLFMYTHSTALVSWNGSLSRHFCVLNGVKQGGVLSPVLFCVYFDELLCKLSGAGYGCHIGDIFVGVLAYADDVVLLAPSPSAMRNMLALCDEFANEYSVAFNANKSKCLVVQPRQNRGLPLLNLPTLNFRVGGNDIEIVSEWPHLGHIISSHCLDDGDIFHRRNCMIGQVNSVLCHFGKLPSSVKSKLLYAYCSSLYGCELWDLWNKNIDTVCVAWRKALRRVWNLPLIHIVTFCLNYNALPVFGVICKRVLSFITVSH